MPKPFKWEGTISHGTLRPEDLIPRFERVLDDLDHDELVILRYRNEQRPGDSEDKDQYLEELEDALNSAAPEGYYFDTHEGDGSDFGFWREEEDDD
jgi:hypothetical protein